MKKWSAILFILAMTNMACKKNRSCECKNNNGTYPAGDYEGTKRQAKKHCESLSSGETKCYLK